MEGWIQLSRKLLDWEYFNDDLMLRGWLYLLLKANHEDKVWRGLLIKRGQYVTSLSKMAKNLDVSIQQTRRILNTLKSTHEIASVSTNKFTLISICKYEYYQGGNKKAQQAIQQIDEQALQHEHQQALQQQLNNIIKDKGKNLPSNDGMSDEGSSDQQKPNEVVDFVALKGFFNKTMESSNAVIPKIASISDKRKGSVNARVREHGKRAVFEVITKASSSDFLNGKNNKGWIANFDWLFLPTNFQKVLEGNYDNHETSTINNGHSNNGTDRNTKLLQDGARAIAALAAEGGKPVEPTW